MGPEIDILPYLILPAAGFLGMYSGAYWGGGSSWLLVPVLLFLGASPMEAAGISLLQMTVAAAVPVVRQSPSIGWGRGSVGRGLLLPVATACALFTLLGVTVNSWTYHKVGGVFFNVIFALFMLGLCINCLTTKVPNNNAPVHTFTRRDSLVAFLFGTGIGFFGALFGVAGGVFIRPLLINKFKLPENIVGPGTRFLQLATTSFGGIAYLFWGGDLNEQMLIYLGLIILGGVFGFSMGVNLHKKVCDNGYGPYVNKSFALVTFVVMISLTLRVFNLVSAAKVVMFVVAVALFAYLYLFGRYTARHPRRAA